MRIGRWGVLGVRIEGWGPCLSVRLVKAERSLAVGVGMEETEDIGVMLYTAIPDSPSTIR